MKSRSPFFPQIFVYLLLLLFAPLSASAEVTIQEARTWNFDGITFTNDFPGGRINALEQTGDREFRIQIEPENSPINNSAWYAFEVVSKRPETITVTLDYKNGRHRYRPKISDDFLNWRQLDRSRWVHDKKTKRAILTLDVDQSPIRIAGQEMIGKKEIEKWIDEMAEKDFIRKSTIGKSLLGQPIQAMHIGSPEAHNYVFIISRQHPPEISGTIALINFVETIAKNSDLSERFRENFQVIVVPMVNPDGADHGHWRHNMAGVDLNRDWIQFAQPETRAVRDFFLELAEPEEARPFLFLDFHSTFRDIFYTQEDEDPTFPENFTAKWLAALQKEFPDYKVRRKGSFATEVMSQTWSYKTFGIPSITYEIGDHTDRDLIRELTTFTSEEMMRMLLAEVDNKATAEPVSESAGGR